MLLAEKEILKNVGVRFKQLREYSNVDKISLAESIGQRVGYITQLEAGQLDPRLPDLMILINQLDLPLSEFFKDFE